MFHVMTHAFFKACLFLGSGSVIHALAGEQDIRRMGGLRTKMPMTYWTFLVATLDDRRGAAPRRLLLEGRDHGGRLPRRIRSDSLDAEAALGRGPFTAGLTAFYMFRLLGLTFWGRFRGTPEQEIAHPRVAARR